MKGLREAISSAYDEEEDTTTEEETTNEEERDESPELDAEETESSDGEEEENQSTDTEEGTDEDASEEEAGDSQQGLGDSDGIGDPPGINAPIGFSPQAREEWKNVPDIVKEQIHKREKEIEEAVRNTGEFRRTHQSLTDLSQKYHTVLTAEGANTPMEAIQGLFDVAARLRLGSPQQKAAQLANLVGHYGVDINMLDQALAGQAPNPSDPTSQLDQLLDQRLAPVNEFLQQQQQVQQQQVTQQQEAINNELQEFSKTAEFINDVRYDMADLIDLASKQGRQMSFKEAYDKACAMNPEISKVLQQREEAEKLKNAEQETSRKLAASSSIPSNNSSNVQGGKTPADLRGQIESVWESYS